MGFLEKRRRNAHARSMNWPMMAHLMLLGHEMALLEAEGVPNDDDLMRRATEKRDAVLEVISEERFTLALIAADFEMSTGDKDAVVARAVETSGYLAARRGMNP